MQRISFPKNTIMVLSLSACLLFFASDSFSQKLQVNDSNYFEKRGVNVFVFSYEYSGMFFDEKNISH